MHKYCEIIQPTAQMNVTDKLPVKQDMKIYDENIVNNVNINKSH